VSGLETATLRMAGRLEATMDSGLRLRAVRDSDGPALTHLIGSAYDEFACGPLDPGGFDADLAAPATFARDRDRRWWVVTTADDVPVASVAHGAPHVDPTGGDRDDRGDDRSGPVAVELHRLYLAPDVRGRGLAARLVAGVAEEARTSGGQRLVAWSDTRLVAAHVRYLALGFTLSVGSRELGDPAGTTEVRFELDLR